MAETVMLDRNKTALTHRTTALAAAYLDGLGCKPVETEVPVQPGWIADVASYWYPTRTESKKLGIEKLAKELIDNECREVRDLMPFVYGTGPFSVLVEVKTSRADFARDQRKWKSRPAHLCFVAYPTGVVDDVPEGWYGIEVTKEAKQVRKLHRTTGQIHAQHPGVLIDFIAAVGIRRDHRTTRRATADWWKAYNAEEGEKKIRYASDNLMRGIYEWLNGMGFYGRCSFEEMLSANGIKKPSGRTDKAIEYFKSLRKSS